MHKLYDDLDAFIKNLYNFQVNKPITKSPVLLPCYSGHLTRLQCSNWSTQSPFPSKYHGITVDPPPTYESLHSAQSSRRLSSVFVPRFVKVSAFSQFTVIRIASGRHSSS